jgi:hypothetical protein
MLSELDQFKEDTAMRLFGRSRHLAITGNQCEKCGAHNLEFRDELSCKEHGISGFCQSCQDDIFGPSDEDKEEVLGTAHEIFGEEN